MIDELKAAIAAKQAEYRAVAGEAERVWRPLANDVKLLQKQLQDFMTKGAERCFGCGAHPLAVEKMLRDRSNTGGVPAFEVGCAGRCRHAVIDTSLAAAIEQWNDQYGARVR